MNQFTRHHWGYALVLLTGWLLLVMSLPVFAQTIQSFSVFPHDDTVTVTYDIIDTRRTPYYQISLLVSTDGGLTFPISALTASGEIRYGIGPGPGKTIHWDPLRQGVELTGDNIVFRLRGRTLEASKLLEFVVVKGDTFEMGDTFGEGSDDELVLRQVALDDFEMGISQVTNTQYAMFLRQYGSDRVRDGQFAGEPMIVPVNQGLRRIDKSVWVPDSGCAFHPVVGVTWYGAVMFAVHNGGRLPTEAEWEFAAREEGKKVRFGSGKNIADPGMMNFDAREHSRRPYSLAGRYQGRTTRITEFPGNALGLFDMSGNAWQWCQDWYSRFEAPTTAGPLANPKGPPLGRYKVIRGGSWNTSALGARAAERSFLAPYEGRRDVSFRIVRPVQVPADSTEQ